MALVLLPFLFSAALVASVATQGCPKIHISESEPHYFSLEESNFFTLWFRINDDITINKEWVATFKFGFGEDSTKFTNIYQLVFEKIKKRKYLACTLTKTAGGKKYLEERLSQSWFTSEDWVGVSMQHSRFTLYLNHNGTQLHIQLKDQQLENVKTIEVKADLDIGENCHIPEEHSTTAATTTSTTTTTTTTQPTTTTVATTTEPTPTEPYAASTTSTHFETTLWMVTDLTGDQGNASTSPVTEKGAQECHKIPLWVWVCVGLMASFFVFFIILLIYTIVLCRRNWSLQAAVARQSQHLRGRIPSPGGYGEEARDMHYYGMRNQNLMIGGTTPRIRTPSPRQPSQRFDSNAKTLSCTRSLSHPGSSYLAPTINFPAAPREEPPPEFLEEMDLSCTCDSEEHVFNEMDSLTGKKMYNISENNLADDERSTSSYNRSTKRI